MQEKSAPQKLAGGGLRPFDRLEEMMSRQDLNNEAKRRILSEWERDARALSRTENEGLGGSIDSRLDEIQRAQRKLERVLEHTRNQQKHH